MTRDEADAALRTALANVAGAYGLVDDDELLGDYAVIVNWSKVEADGQSRYTTHFHQTPCPLHVAIGLFQVGLDLVGEEPDRS